MIKRPVDMGRFQFVALAALRAGQLMRGCRPRVDGPHSTAILALMEVSEGKITQSPLEIVDVLAEPVV